MNDIERVKQMVDEGRITSAEGERLITILTEVEEGDAALQAAAEPFQPPAVAGTPMPPIASAAEAQAEPPAAAPGAPQAAPQATPAAGPQIAPALAASAEEDASSAPEGLRWVRIEMLAGDLGVSVDSSIREPVADSGYGGELEVETTANGFKVLLQPKDAGFVDRMLSGFRVDRVELRIPVGYGADIAATAGNIELAGVPYLRGRLTAGNLDAVGLRGINFTTMAGDVDVGVALITGEHRIAATAGDVTVKFHPDCDVKVSGSVSMGEIDSKLPGLEATRQGLGQRFTATLGAGSAALDVRLATGQLSLEPDYD